MIPYAEKDVILKAENVSLSFGDKQILRDVNFEIHNVTRSGVSQGQVVSLIGRSGIGKTQLFKILSGIMAPTNGRVKIGVDQKPVEAGDVGIVPQNYILFNHRSILKNLMIALEHSDRKLNEKEKKEIIDKYARDFDLADHLAKYPLQLSGGQRQRVSILQQILTGNKFILLDEPFSGLDAIMVDKVIDLLVKISLMDELNTLIIVSHDIQNSMAISDLVWVLAQDKGHPGATIMEQVDLKKDGLAWRSDIRMDPAFQKSVDRVKSLI